jgi:16S rRNA (guanine(966)-N(2))-methyltransferase RsmD
VVPDIAGLRPTPDRVRESLFNWLVHFRGGSLSGLSALDLFAGSGALGFEAASRGAGRVLLVETQESAVVTLRKAKEKLKADQIEIQRADALGTAHRLVAAGERFDIVFLDPPFHSGWIERTVPTVVALLAAGGLLYVECEAPLDVALATAHALELLRADKAGQVFYHLLRRKIGNIPGENTPC